eukprot:6483059-Pyramimonas_sp.AAC.1
MEDDGVASTPSRVEEDGARPGAEIPQECVTPPQLTSTSMEPSPTELPANSAVEEGWVEQVGSAVPEGQTALPEEVSPAAVPVSYGPAIGQQYVFD